MKVSNLSLPATNQFATQYLARDPEIQHFFHYEYQEISDYKARLLEIQNRQFMRKELADCIEAYMKPYPTSQEVQKSLAKLKEKDSVVVIGGQQAGILTGPLYSIHKIISIISLARQKEAELNVPVVPVFWIAGEDHDFQEVNHIYMEKDGEVQKNIYPEKVLEKKMVSDIVINKEKCMQWVEDIIGELGETDHTKSLLLLMQESIQQSTTWVDFFAHIVMTLFKEEGLLIIDSGSSEVRSLEKEIFISQIEHVTAITEAVQEVQKELVQRGFHPSIDITDYAANLFYYDEDHSERIFLEYDQEQETFIGKNGEIHFTKNELLHIASEFPSRLSNNVVTRPIMQEMLFPTLAFIAGPGEIAYWAELKKVFELFAMKMPLIVPRLNITLVDRSVKTDLDELGLILEEVLVKGTKGRSKQYLASLRDHDLEALFQQTKDQLMGKYGQIHERIDKGLFPLLEKNQKFLLEQIEFMERQVERSLQQKHQNVLNKFKRVEHKLRPLESPQERILNAVYFINLYGLSFFADLSTLSYEFDGMHKVINI